MATVQIQDVVVPGQFTSYIVENSIEKSALVTSGIVTRNAAIDSQLQAGADSFSAPFWKDLADDEANIANDDPAILAVPRKLSSGKQIVRKAFLHQSWAAMNLASELSGANALGRIQDRVAAYWTRQAQKRLIASLAGIMADNVANDSSDMVADISAAVGALANFSANAVLDAAGSLGDGMRDFTAIGMHSATYKAALKADMIVTLPDSQGGFIQTFRGLGILVDDGLPVASSKYTTVLFGPGAVGYGTSSPRIASGTEIENIPGAGNGGGQQILHSRVNLAMHPLGFQWKETTVAGDSPTIAELALAVNWDRVAQRKNVPVAYIIHKLA
ncbi:hypothetical protein [Rhodoferax antarcticus]|uniref:Phage coat protein n=1 Tax=Rhodoferax antarcticus ANT.BR TaxID=1111071 RepID=A0A1Q8YAJ9_9BURK|nr:hypothetical protein [Rhodoferax antarcticus]APW47064.1 hypothetical protein RA876_12640 [Rhodoferax antarcticus]OLP04939.1 hypothetical protein BLL52_3759 [Rhodoferax antarcticus ANT.BR]